MNQNWYYSLMLMFGFSAVVCFQLLLLPSQALAHSSPQVDKPPVQVYLNGNRLSFSHTPYLQQNHTLVPVRDFLHALGADVQWNSTKKTITASKMDDRLVLWLSSDQGKMNDKSLLLPLPVQLHQGKAYAPLRVIAEAFHGRVHWHNSDHSVRIRTSLSYQDAEQLVRKQLNLPLETIVEYDHDDEDGAYVIHVYDWVESEGQPGMTATKGWYRVEPGTGKIQSMFD